MRPILLLIWKSSPVKGNEIYERVVRPKLRPEYHDQFVAIDIESEGFAFDRSDFAATERLLKDHPDALIWLVRVGQPTAYRIGGYSSASIQRSAPGLLTDVLKRSIA